MSSEELKTAYSICKNVNDHRKDFDDLFYQHELNPLDFYGMMPNSHIPYKLKHIKAWCHEPEQQRNLLAMKLVQIIQDKQYQDDEAEFVINSIPFSEFQERGKAEEYSRYCGYDMYQVV